VRVLMNRCAHKGTKVVYDVAGNTGKTFRCPYHAWTYRTDGTLLNIPLKSGLRGNEARAQGLTPITHESYRGFVFARLADGPGLPRILRRLAFLDRQPRRPLARGRARDRGGCLRYLHNCNWKMFVENLNDTMHPMIVHASSAGTARKLWEGKPADLPKPMAIEQYAPFANDYKFFDDMGVRVYPHGHGFSGVNFSIHSSYSSIPEYEQAMKRAYGEERAKQILGTVRHNTVYYPSLTIKGAIQSIRVARPLAAGPDGDRILDLPPEGRARQAARAHVMYNRLINSPMSVVGHDDLHCYRSAQEGLAAEGNEWVSLHRNFDPAELSAGERTCNGTSEISMRNQFRAWREFMRHDRGGTSPGSSTGKRGCSTRSASTSGTSCSPRTATTGCRSRPARPIRWRTTRSPTRTSCCSSCASSA
jgi:nitrite reductase/ring-hydroxylating ferredoxin subunit